MADDTDSPQSVGNADDGSGAIAAMAMLLTAIESGCGITYYDEPRDDGVTNEQIIKWQAEGVRRRDRIVKRDIRPNADDERAAAEAFQESFQRALDRAAKSGAKIGKGKRRSSDGLDKDENLAAVASSMRAAGKAYAEAYQEKFANKRDASGAPLENVEATYAKARLRKYQISEAVVLQRTGQLARGIEKGRFRLWFDRSKVKQIAASVKSVSDAAEQ